ncbi:MAG: SDR family oxidoreductase [Polyangiaceae bacterium]|nr:SDR family oxidoreductase [Polyangiaceae bacterium]
MKIGVVGGTGTLGKQVVEILRQRGHEVRVLSRHAPDYPVDLNTGAGLGHALQGCDTVVDASNNPSQKGAKATLVEGSKRLLDAENAAGVRHHVCVSIVGCERDLFGYLRIKAAQEKVVERGPVPWTIVRATQFHDLIAYLLGSMARLRVVPLPRVTLQPVASAEAARAVADVAEGQPRRGRVEIIGPEAADLRDLARTWKAITGSHCAVLPLPLAGKTARALRSGVLTTDHPDVRGTIPFATWLKGTAAAQHA